MNTRNIGTVSHGTLRTCDLLSAFADELEDCVQVNAAAWCSDEGRVKRDAYCTLIGDARDCLTDDSDDVTDEDAAADIVNELSDALQDFAPDYVTFGAHPGDGSDFGFWVIDDLQQQAQDDGTLIVSDLSEVPSDFAGGLILHTNDHGNATLYAQDFTGERRELWACV